MTAEFTAELSGAGELPLERSAQRASRKEILASLYERLGRRLYGYACMLAESEDEAADIVQECFLRLGRRRDLESIENLDGYALRTLRNEALRARRRRLSRQCRKEALGALSFTPPAPLDAAGHEEAERIRRAMAELSPVQREVVYLKIWEELTFAQIGALLDISPDTAASRYRYGIGHLGKRLGRTGAGNGIGRSRAD